MDKTFFYNTIAAIICGNGQFVSESLANYDVDDYKGSPKPFTLFSPSELEEWNNSEKGLRIRAKSAGVLKSQQSRDLDRALSSWDHLETPARRLALYSLFSALKVLAETEGGLEEAGKYYSEKRNSNKKLTNLPFYFEEGGFGRPTKW